MFAKKFLNVVGLLFVGNHLINIARAETCVINDTTPTADCQASTSYILNKADCTGSTCTFTNTGTAYVHTCEGTVTTCSATAADSSFDGYFLVSSTTGAVITTAESASTSVVLASCTSGECTIEANPADGYYKDTTNSLYIQCKTDTGCATVSAFSYTGSEACGNSDIGILKKGTTVLCLGNAIEAAFGEGNYLLTGSLAGTSVFTYPAKEGGGGNADGIVITGSSTALVYKKDYAGKSECVEASKVILPRKTNLCTGNSDCANYYTCTADHGCVIDNTNPKPVRQDEEVCNLGTGANCSAGYYITIASGQVIQTTPKGQGAVTTYDLYKCPGGDAPCVEQDDTSGKEIPIGYLPNLGNGQEGTAPLIKFDKSKVCEPVAAGDDCSAAAKIGTVFPTLSGNDITYSLCIKNSDVTVPLFKFTTNTGVYDYSVGSTAEYLVSIANDILDLSTAANHFIAMKTTGTDGTVVVVEDNDGARYKYTNSKATNPYKVYPRSTAKSENSGENDICKADAQGAYGNPAEYIKHEWTENKPTDATVAAYYVDESYSESA